MSFITTNQETPSCPRCSHELDKIKVTEEKLFVWDTQTKTYKLQETGRRIFRCSDCGYFIKMKTEAWVEKRMPTQELPK